MKKNLLTVILFTVVAISDSFAQDLNSDAEKYFRCYMDDMKFYEMVSKSFPTLDDCKLVFKDSIAFKYFEWTDNIKNNIKKLDSVVVYEDIKLDSFYLENITDKKNYPGGMANIKDYLNPGITFYQVKYLKKIGDHYGMTYNSFVNIKGKWVFFPKPWQAFKSSK